MEGDATAIIRLHLRGLISDAARDTAIKRASKPIAKALCQYWFIDRLKKPLPPPGGTLPDAFVLRPKAPRPPLGTDPEPEAEDDGEGAR